MWRNAFLRADFVVFGANDSCVFSTSYSSTLTILQDSFAKREGTTKSDYRHPLPCSRSPRRCRSSQLLDRCSHRLLQNMMSSLSFQSINTRAEGHLSKTVRKTFATNFMRIVANFGLYRVMIHDGDRIIVRTTSTFSAFASKNKQQP